MLYTASENDRDQDIIFAKTENFVMSFALIFAVCNDRHVTHAIGVTQFNNHSRGFHVFGTTALVEEADRVRLVEVLFFREDDPVKGFLSTQRSFEID